jgi:hypothetical protein
VLFAVNHDSGHRLIGKDTPGALFLLFQLARALHDHAFELLIENLDSSNKRAFSTAIPTALVTGFKELKTPAENAVAAGAALNDAVTRADAQRHAQDERGR